MKTNILGTYINSTILEHKEKEVEENGGNEREGNKKKKSEEKNKLNVTWKASTNK